MASEKKTLNVWHLWTTESDANAKSFNIVLKEWQALHPDVEVVIDAHRERSLQDQAEDRHGRPTKCRTCSSPGAAASPSPSSKPARCSHWTDYLADGTKERLMGGALDNVHLRAARPTA